MKGGYYCTKCGTCYSTPGSGMIVCQACGGIGLRGYSRRPRKVACPRGECDWTGWDDGGVNDDLGRHTRRHERDDADMDKRS